MPTTTTTPKSGGMSTFRSFFFFIVLFALLSFSFLFFNFSASQAVHYRDEPLRIVLWDVKETKDKYSTFLGDELYRHGVVHRTCPFNCTFTTDRSNLHMADAVMFDPTAHDHDHWRRIPISMPHKQPYQLWVMSGFEHHLNHPLVAQETYNSFMDLKMVYKQNSDIPLSLFCPWGDKFKGPKDLLEPQDNKNRKKGIMFLSSNCQFSGASARTAYVEDLMRHITVDSYGECLHNTDWEGGKRVPSFSKMEEKIELMKQYKIVLTFENNNVTDFVSEKLFNAFQAGALPVYMGAPNIDDWLPGKDSIVKTSEFKSPAELAKYLQQLLDDEKEYKSYFVWKGHKLNAKFVEKYDNCMYSSACRVCKAVADKLPENSNVMKRELDRPSAYYQSLRLNGEGNCVRVPHHKGLCVEDRYTLMAWVKPASFGDQRIIDKNRAGKISGYNFDIQAGDPASPQKTQGFPRLCAGDACFSTKKGIYKDTWSHIAVVYSSEHASVFENHVDFYINGVLDNSEIVFAPTKKETHQALTFGSNDKDSVPFAFHGSIDNIGIFSRDLSGEEVRKYMFQVPHPTTPDLVGFWSFDDPPSADYVHDIGNNEYDGSIDGAVREPSVEKPLHLNKCH